MENQLVFAHCPRNIGHSLKTYLVPRLTRELLLLIFQFNLSNLCAFFLSVAHLPAAVRSDSGWFSWLSAFSVILSESKCEGLPWNPPVSQQPPTAGSLHVCTALLKHSAFWGFFLVTILLFSMGKGLFLLMNLLKIVQDALWLFGIN